MPKPIHILNGPNLNRLGRREPAIYGSATLSEIETLCATTAEAVGRTAVSRQSNHEGQLIDWLHEAEETAGAVVLNPAGYGHTSVALLDAIKAIETPVVEVHLSNPATRESFRAHSYISLGARGVISGFGPFSYVLGVQAACRLADERNA